MQPRIVGPFSGEVTWPTQVRHGQRLGPSRAQVRGPGWRRTSHGFYVPAQTDRTPQQRVAEASVVVPDGGAITGWAALRWMGGRWFEGTSHGGRVEQPVTVASGPVHIRPQPAAGISVSEESLGPEERVAHDGLWLTTAVRSVAFEMRHASSVTEATVAADMGFFSDLTSALELRAHLAALPPWAGVPLARAALALMHENSWSPMETRLRVLWLVEAALPPPLVNAPVFDLDGQHLGTPDLLDVEAGLAVEYDGADHLRRRQRLRDVRREDVLEDSGLVCLTVLGEELHDRGRLVGRLQRARRRAVTEVRARRWTTTPPPWWRSLDTVARRREDRRRRRSA